jgi:hypothetical protein
MPVRARLTEDDRTLQSRSEYGIGYYNQTMTLLAKVIDKRGGRFYVALFDNSRIDPYLITEHIVDVIEGLPESLPVFAEDEAHNLQLISVSFTQHTEPKEGT